MTTSPQNNGHSHLGSSTGSLQLRGMNGSLETPTGQMAHSSTFSASSPPPNAIALLKALRRRWLLGLLCGLAAAAVVGIGVWYFLPPAQQLAYAKLYCPVKPQAVLEKHPEGQIDFQTFQKTQASLIKSRATLEAALNRAEIIPISSNFSNETGYPEEWLAQKIKVEFPDSPEIMRVSLERPTELEAKLLVQAITESYLEKFADQQMSQRRERLVKLNEILNKDKTELAASDTRIAKLSKKFGVGDPVQAATRQGFGDQIAHDTRLDILNKNRELREARLEYRLMMAGQQPATTSIDKDVIEELVNVDPLVVELERSLARDQEDLDVKLKDAKKLNDPTISALKEKTASTKTKLQSLKQRISASLEERLKQKQLRESHQSAEKLRIRIEYLEAALLDLNRELDRLTRNSTELNDGGFELAVEQEARKRVATDVDKVNDEIHKLTVELQDPPRVMPLEAATVVHVEDFPRRLRISGMAALGALLAVLFGVSLLEFRSHRIDSADEVVNRLGMNVMGALPAYHARGRLGFSATNGTASAFQQDLLMDSIDAVRTMLVHAAQSGSLRVVMITSAVSGEGKTSLATHLAGSMARAGYKTLLVDADLRRPALDRLFDLPTGPGLCELLRGEVEIAAAIQPSQVPDLWVMPAGRWNILASRALARGRLQPILDQLRDPYECVIVDSSPLLLTADALSTATNVDGVLFAIMHDVSRLPRVHAAYQRLEALGVRILGAVVNGAVVERPQYGPRYVSATVESSSSPPASS